MPRIQLKKMRLMQRETIFTLEMLTMAITVITLRLKPMSPTLFGVVVVDLSSVGLLPRTFFCCLARRLKNCPDWFVSVID